MSISIAALFRVFLKIGLLSFGGPAAQIVLMHRVLVDEQKWLDDTQFLNALSFCMLLPGPEAMQLATYSGWRLRGMVGGLIAGMLFVLPGAIVILVLAALFAEFGDLPLLTTLFLGVKAAVLVIVIQALLRVSKRSLKSLLYWLIAGLSFIGIFFFSVPFPLIILGAAIIGFFAGAKHEKPPAVKVETSIWSGALVLFVGLVVWFLPILLLSNSSILADIGWFFSKLAVATFGGAYAVLAYMAQDVVTSFGWLSAAEMMDGLGLAETTPGPLILVTEFVGFIAAYGEGGFLLGVAGAGVALWSTFVPCFIWIFIGAPYIDWMSAQPRLAGALKAITAAVVGVILNLSIWFALHVVFASVSLKIYGWVTLWQPEFTSFDWRVGVLFGFCAIMLLHFKMGVGRLLILSPLLGWLLVTFL